MYALLLLLGKLAEAQGAVEFEIKRLRGRGWGRSSTSDAATLVCTAAFDGAWEQSGLQMFHSRYRYPALIAISIESPAHADPELENNAHRNSVHGFTTSSGMRDQR